jgi:hypothetical protein
VKVPDLSVLLSLATDAPWFARGRFLSRVPGAIGVGAGLPTNHVGNADRNDCVAIAALRNHADAMIALVTAVTAWRDMRHDNLMRAVRQTSAEVESESAEAHLERVKRLIAAAQAIEAALSDFEEISWLL